MAVAFNGSEIDTFEFPCVAMSFINHDAVLYKIFVIGSESDVVLRPSIRNLSPGDFPLERFHSAQVSKPDADHPLIGPNVPEVVTSTASIPISVLAAEQEFCGSNGNNVGRVNANGNEAELELGIDVVLMAKIAKRCQDRTEQRLLGVDVVIEKGTGRYGVIDMNRFPGKLCFQLGLFKSG
jgi:inositol-1,3,4-trisphosphate 5/6-kinase/inositol-tetrakisphosphate 1-kinase